MKGATATALLRPALEAAVVVAREGERTVPATPAPVSLKRYLNFARLPDPALEVARKVLDDDAAFRSRVADAAQEQVVGRPGWLFLHRPDGWEAELDRLLQAAAAAEIAARDERHDRGAQKKLAGAEAALARAEASARASAAAADAVRADLHRERTAAQALVEEVDRLRSDLERLEVERGELIRRLKATEATANQRTSELRGARHELRMVQAELASALAGIVTDQAPVADEPVGPSVAVDEEAFVTARAEADDALRRLVAALGSLTSAVELPDADEALSREPESTAARSRPRRVPTPLPPGLLDDAPEAGEHLVRTPGVLVLVDGYNVSHAQWYGLPPADQRARLLARCGELRARCGTEIEVVFDGDGEAETMSHPEASEVRHRFTAVGVEADDVVLARIEEEPVSRPVVVVSSDRRVRDGAVRRGANVLGAKQFLSTLHR